MHAGATALMECRHNSIAMDILDIPKVVLYFVKSQGCINGGGPHPVEVIYCEGR